MLMLCLLNIDVECFSYQPSTVLNWLQRTPKLWGRTSTLQGGCAAVFAQLSLLYVVDMSDMQMLKWRGQLHCIVIQLQKRLDLASLRTGKPSSYQGI